MRIVHTPGIAFTGIGRCEPVMAAQDGWISAGERVGSSGGAERWAVAHGGRTGTSWGEGIVSAAGAATSGGGIVGSLVADSTVPDATAEASGATTADSGATADVSPRVSGSAIGGEGVGASRVMGGSVGTAVMITQDGRISRSDGGVSDAEGSGVTATHGGRISRRERVASSTGITKTIAVA
jgi:hypothetical protein